MELRTGNKNREKKRSDGKGIKWDESKDWIGVREDKKVTKGVVKNR